MNKPLKGIIPPMVTPFLSDFSLDIQGIKNLVEHFIKGGVHGVFILGTTGESTSLSYLDRARLIAETCTAVDSRIPVLVGITDTSLAESVNLAEKAAKLGADAVVAAPPFYFNIGQRELIAYYRKLADNLPLPLFLYNMPALTHVTIEVETVKLLSDHPNIIGFKDSSGSGVYYQKICHALKSKPEFSLFVGPEEMTAQTVLTGGHGGINGGANLFPRLYVDLYEALSEKDFDRIKALQHKVMEVSTHLYSVGPFQTSYLLGLKTAMSIMGICESYVLPPLLSFDEEDKKKIADGLKKVQEVI